MKPFEWHAHCMKITLHITFGKLILFRSREGAAWVFSAVYQG